jgi:glycosyltransferase involved in cell wall biosynthesis
LKYSLVIPCYNEAASIPELVQACEKLILNPDIEIILVDNGSTDKTSVLIDSEIARVDSPNFRTVQLVENEGYGNGVLAGLDASSGEYVGWAHADLQVDLEESNKALELIQASSKPIYAKGLRRGRGPLDSFFTVGMSLYESLTLRRWLWDINAQPNFLPREFFLKTRTLAPKDFSLDLYFFFMARKHGLQVRRFPVVFAARRHGASSWNTGMRSRFAFVRRTLAYTRALKKTLS